MRLRGEITVFLSLILVCVLSLMMGLLESARTVGARWYLQMAADSSMASVMSQYNRNLWDMYQLLFLEYESEEAIENSFETYFDFYVDQENLYPMRKKEVELTKLTNMGDHGARGLEQEILSYIGYRLPDAAADLLGISEEAAEAARAGNLRNLLEVCNQAGKKTRKLEKRRRDVEESLVEMGKLKEKLISAADMERERRFLSGAEKLRQEMRNYSKCVEAYEKELINFSRYAEEVREKTESSDSQVTGTMEQERMAYEQAEEAARQALLEYREKETTVKAGLEILEEAVSLAEEGKDSEDETDWDEVRGYVEDISLPLGKKEAGIDKEKEKALDWLAEFFEKDLLDYLVPEGTEISNRSVELGGIPSVNFKSGIGEQEGITYDIGEQILINEYIGLYFSSFAGENGEGGLPEERALSYEQEYLLCGKSRDRENLSETAEALLTVRGAMNLAYLLNSSEKRAQADSLAASVSAGNIPLQLLVSFLVLTVWAMGEAVCDVRILLDGGKVPFWKNEDTWKTSLTGLLSRDFLADRGGIEEEDHGRDYEDYLRILLFLKERTVRNFRMMDLIQWNVRKKQADFSIEDCAYEIEVKAEVLKRHLFLMSGEYAGIVTAAGSYE